MKTFFIIRALFIAITSFFLSLYIENTTITALTLGIVCLGFIANLAVYKALTSEDNEDSEADSYHSAHSL